MTVDPNVTMTLTELIDTVNGTTFIVMVKFMAC